MFKNFSILLLTFDTNTGFKNEANTNAMWDISNCTNPHMTLVRLMIKKLLILQTLYEIIYQISLKVPYYRKTSLIILSYP